MKEMRKISGIGYKERAVRIIAVMAMALMMTVGMAVTASAESKSFEGSCTFTGSRMVSSFSSAEVAKAVQNLQPGDDVTFSVTYKNAYSESTDWYMENTVIKTLEKTAQSKKHVEGTGAAEGGGYTYELIHIDKNGKQSVLFSNKRVGGEAKPGNMEGLEQATNALDDWFYLETLGKNESGKVILNVAFDGETEVNDYMDTDGELNLRFAVELTKTKKVVKTGDYSNMIMWASIALISGVLLLALAFISRRMDTKAEAGKGGDK